MMENSDMMKKMMYLLIVGLLFSNCSHRIVRTGYQIKKSDYTTCDVAIKKTTSIPDSLVTKIGEIKLGESGLAVACSEKHAIDILKGEACAINADLIIITEEKRPDFWSSCYRCRAEFYQFNSTDYDIDIKSEEIYSKKNVQDRVSKDRMKNAFMAVGAVTAGFLLGFVLFL